MPQERTAQVVMPWQKFIGPNLGYLQELYEQYRQDPSGMDPRIQELFARWGAPPLASDAVSMPVDLSVAAVRWSDEWADARKAVAAGKLARNLRTYGHLAAKINPLDEAPVQMPLFDLETYRLTEEDLRRMPAKIVWEDAPDNIQNGLQAIDRLKKIYTRSLAYEFDHVHHSEERVWLYRMVESGAIHRFLSTHERIQLLKRLTEVEGFEKFLQRTFVGQKRFSIEGLDALVPLLDEIIRLGAAGGVRHVMIGMAHRGRLNVLAHILGKPLEVIFGEFHTAPNKDLVPSEGSMGMNYGWTGDVKYHLGANRALQTGDRVRMRLTLANNPSHLEFVDPVVLGFARASQERREAAGPPVQDVTKAFAILIHGDAAFSGEGVVAETLNLSQLKGYHTGGSIHVIANNQLGFTTEKADARSTKYASDLAKGFEIPIVHVNADDIEACLMAARLACEYRARFHKDFLIDLVGYRRLGHHEMDDPSVTQPQMYEKINRHPTARAIYADTLRAAGLVTEQQIAEMADEVEQRLKDAYEKTKERRDEVFVTPSDWEIEQDADTSVPLDKLREINRALLRRPEGFSIYPKLERILSRREHALDEGGKVDWALAETLAFATILADGRPIRLTGQDSERGTFAQRHLVLHDIKTGESYSPLHLLPQARASFSIHNSPLSEASVLGFEYGYDVFADDTLVLWEAQYGDFANVAQVIIDQFIAAGLAKWGQHSGLVMLLPHGYEGQGPEHSSARLERFLQLAAENNVQIANLTTAAQYFHMLRRQAVLLAQNKARPLILMTPKSLLRNPYTASPPERFSEGRFFPVIEPSAEQPEQEAAQVKRLICCSGKVAIDLQSALDQAARPWLRILRVERLYPFPEEEIARAVARYSNLEEVVWVQEEPQNMGAWFFVEPQLRGIVSGRIPLRYIGRPRRSSPAEGLPDVHDLEQSRIVDEALRP